MQWFKKWYYERFVSRSKCECQLNVDKKNKNNTECYDEQLLKVTNQKPQSKTLVYDNKNDKNNSSDLTDKKIPSKIVHQTTNTLTAIQLADKRKIEPNNDCRSSDTISSNVNTNGNGESGGTSAQSKETRRRKIIIVRKSNDNWHRNQNNRKDIQIEKDRFGEFIENGDDYIENSECNGEQILSISNRPSDCFLEQRAGEIETFVKHVNGNVYNTGNENILNDWVVISLNVDYSRTIDGLSDDEDDDDNDSIDNNCWPLNQYYTTSEFCNFEDSTIITVHRCSSQTSLWLTNESNGNHLKLNGNTTFNCNRKHGLIRRLGRILNILHLNAQTGSVSLNIDKLTKMKNTLNSSENPRKIISIESLYLSEEFQNINVLLQNPCSINKMTAEKEFFANQSDTDHSSISSSKSNLNDLPVEQYFGLNECGDIIIHVDHICENEGFGFMMRRKKQLYKNVAVGKEVQEKKFNGIRMAIKNFFKEIMSVVRKSCCGE